ncbi:MAG TPA: hypothetical protein PLQ11_03780 [Beijerinckiaceae bacterium]|nr:hypothetical protein [Beijerinckiaceae bacterium]
MKLLRNGALAGSAIALVLVAASPASAQLLSDPLDEVLSSIGLKDRERDPIDYRERAPLVVPPSGAKLRSPEAPAGANNPAWPLDPDVAARRAKAAESKTMMAPPSDRDPSQGGLVRGAEGHKRNARAGVPTSNSPGYTGEEPSPMRSLSPDQVGRILASSPESSQPSGIEPQRQYLTEPPKGYRRAAAGAPVRATVEPMPSGNDSVQMNVLQPRR